MPELLGTASFPSGDLLLIDFGLLPLWSGDRPPLVPDELAEPEVVAMANASTDFEIVGPQAFDAAKYLDLALVRGRYAFDVPQDGPPVAERVADSGLDATVRPIARMPHHTRVVKLLDDEPDGVEVQFNGAWCVAVRGLPAGPLRVLGERMAPGQDADKWRSVWVECAQGVPARSVAAGHALVNESRLMFTDAAALNSWNNFEPVDGLMDIGFWGKDEAAVAKRLDVPEEHQWTDLTIDEARPIVEQLNSLREQGLLFAYAIQPHDDHHRMRNAMLESNTHSGAIEVGGAVATGLFVNWGGGAYPVFRDLAADGTLLRVRVEFWSGDLDKTAVVSARVARDGELVRWLYREEPTRPEDSGWRIFAGDETQEYADDVRNSMLMPLRELINADRDLEALFDQPPGSAFDRDEHGFVPSED